MTSENSNEPTASTEDPRTAGLVQGPVCTVLFHGDKCPNQYRPNKDGALVEREQGKHEAALAHVTRHREAMEALRDEEQFR